MLSEFTQWASKWVRQNYKPVKYLSPNDSEIFINAFNRINKSDLTHGQKEKMRRALRVIEDTATPVTSYTNGHVKKEITFGSDWPRLIAAREDGLRALSAVLYDEMVE